MTVKLSVQDLETLAALFEKSDWKELHIRYGGSDLFLSKDGAAMPRASAASPARVPAPAAAPARSASAARPPAVPAGNASAADPANAPAGWTVVCAPNLGTFYRAPKPGAAPFTEIDAVVGAESELCLIEVMKLFTSVRAGVGGHVRAIYAEDAQLVEAGHPLFLIEPDA